MATRVRPAKEANKISQVLDRVLTADERFPVDVETVAKEYSLMIAPDEPISKVVALDVDGFEGALRKAPKGKKGWAILYNERVLPGRQNFTLAHEFGHYILHRKSHPNGINCSEEEYALWGSDANKIEQEANEFAANLLMPLNDFRGQIKSDRKITYDEISKCTERYNTSYTATLSRWLAYTESRAVMVASRDGYILWSRSSTKALKTGAYIKTANQSPILIPSISPNNYGIHELEHDKRSWFEHEACSEVAVVSDAFDIKISLLQLHPHNVNYKEYF